MRITFQVDSRVAKRLAVAVGVIGALAWPVWVLASQVTGLHVFKPGETIRAADFNTNFQLLATAQNDTDNKLTNLSSQVTVVAAQGSSNASQLTLLAGQESTSASQLTTLQGQMTTLQGLVTTLQGQLTGANTQVTALQAQVAQLLGASAAIAVSGTLDGTFNTIGSTGISGVLPSIEPPVVGIVAGPAIDSAGRLVVAYEDNGQNLNLARFNSDGSLDTTFGSAKLSAPGSTVSGLVLDSTGRILVVGTMAGAAQIWRFTSNGSGLDTTWAFSGIQILPTPSAGNAIAVDSAGNVVATGFTGSGTSQVMTVWRFLSTNGTPDPSFGPGGLGFLADAGQGAPATGNALVLDAQQRIYIAGSSTGPLVNATCWRLTSSGILDSSFTGFGLTGASYVTEPSAKSSVATAIALDLSGNVVLGGQAPATGALPTAELWRMTSTGINDGTFSGIGIGMVPVDGVGGTVTGLAVDSANRIIAAVTLTASPPPYVSVIARFLPSGAGDPTFGIVQPGGSSFLQLPGFFSGLVIDANHKICLAGGNGSGSINLMVWRLD
jgi:uncharacterized delta-60 repeat protein